jgi:hypothetical protein
LEGSLEGDGPHVSRLSYSDPAGISFVDGDFQGPRKGNLGAWCGCGSLTVQYTGARLIGLTGMVIPCGCILLRSVTSRSADPMITRTPSVKRQGALQEPIETERQESEQERLHTACRLPIISPCPRLHVLGTSFDPPPAAHGTGPQGPTGAV